MTTNESSARPEADVKQCCARLYENDLARYLLGESFHPGGLQTTRRLGDLLRLNKGSIVETACPYTSDVPLRANGLLIGWTEFEVIGNRLAVRITELA